MSVESRRAARRQAVFLLYQRDVTGLPIFELEANAERDRARVLDAYTRAMVTGVLQDLETIDADDYVGSDTELFTVDGDIGILYFDGRYNNMKAATHDANGWATETLGGDDGAVGFFNETIESNGTRYVASYDYTHKHLFWKAL